MWVYGLYKVFELSLNGFGLIRGFGFEFRSQAIVLVRVTQDLGAGFYCYDRGFLLHPTPTF